MFNKLKNIKEHIAQGKNAFTFDASRFNDPVAEQVQWTPLKSGGSNFTTHNLVEANPNRLEFQPGIKSKMFSFVFIGVGILVPIFFILNAEGFEGAEIWQMVAFSLVFGGIFIAGGLFSLRSSNKLTVFDKSIGKYWRGKEGPDVKPGLMNHESVYDLSGVYALQLLSHYVRSDKSSYYIYELNFILDDLKRVNIMRHGGKAVLRRDAEKLAEFMGKPLWDAAG